MKRWVFITGGGRGIGKAIAIDMAKNNYQNLVLTYQKNKGEVEKLKKELEAEFKLNCEILALDFNQTNLVKKNIIEWQNNHSEDWVEILINNAGFNRDSLFPFMSFQDWKDVVLNGLESFYLINNFFIKNMILQKMGRIINIVSLAGVKGNAGQTNYAALKGAIIAATKSMALEVATKNITINAIAPGFIDTEMIKDLSMEDWKKIIPLKRTGKPEEVAYLVSFLASQKASYITGQVIHISGGLYT